MHLLLESVRGSADAKLLPDRHFSSTHSDARQKLEPTELLPCMLEEMFGCANRRVKQVTPAQPKRQPSAKELEHEEINVLIFTDIQDSTKLWQSIPDTMPTVLATHDECVRALIEAHGGYEVKTEGDAFMISFTSAGDAVEFAASLQPALLKCEWPEEALDQPACCEQTSEVGSLLWKGREPPKPVHLRRSRGELGIQLPASTGPRGSWPHRVASGSLARH